MASVRTAGILSLVLAFLVAFSLPSSATNRERGYEHYVFGKTHTKTPGQVSGGLLLLGGGDRNVGSMKWFFAKAGNGHIVVLSASYGKEIGEEFYNDISGIQSTEIFVMHARSQSTNATILDRLRKADGIFIAGGDQSRYVRYWRGTPIAEILNAHVAAGKPLAGTSAGLAMLGEKLYGAMDDGSLTSSEALSDPMGPANTIEGDFLQIALLKGIITDTHFKERDRLGRLLAFLAKAQVGRDPSLPPMMGLGIDESAALAVEPDGTGRIYATEPDGYGWLVDGAGLRNATLGLPLDAPRVRITGIGPKSIVHLPSGRVDAPAFERIYSARDGKLTLRSTLSLR